MECNALLFLVAVGVIVRTHAAESLLRKQSRRKFGMFVFGDVCYLEQTSMIYSVISFGLAVAVISK